MKMKLTAALLALLVGLVPAPAPAQNLNADRVPLVALYDLESTDFIYCATLGLGSTSTARNKVPPQGAHRLSTTGSSTTVVSAGTLGSFTNVAVGDVLFINDDGVMLSRVVTARASANSITVNSAVNLTNAPFEYRTRSCGTADTSGAIPVSGFHSHTWTIDIGAITATGIIYQLECRLFGPDSTWNIISGPTTKTAVFRGDISTDLGYDECRLGFKIDTDGAGVEEITAHVGWRK